MSGIRILSEQIANQIAAGEVVERPASVVKELVENALDAGAKSVDIEIAAGGRKWIRVSDDGAGIPAGEVRLAFERHATSKISALEDLQKGIASFGFRGEALPSIAAVSRCRLISRTSAEGGTEVVIEGGIFKGEQPHPCRKGTIVEVRDLFFNTPARRKFLKGEPAEMGHVLEGVGCQALAAVGTGWRLTADGKTVLNLPPAGSLAERAEALLSRGSPGRFLEIDAEREGMRLTGVLSKPELNRASRREIRVFVNRRWVKSLPLAYALTDGYHGLLMEGRYPVAALFLNLEGARVDVNVHPAKLEVRIEGLQEIARWVREAVRERLRSAPDLAPKFGLPGGWAGVQKGSGTFWTQPHLCASQKGQTLPPLDAAPSVTLGGKLAVTRILGQIHRTFLVAETEEGFVVVDQHAAHERVVFEALLKGMRSGKPERQMLLMEQTLEMPPAQVELFEAALPLLKSMGFDLDRFGPHTAVVRALPAALGETDAAALLRAFLDQAEEGKVRTSLEEAQEAAAALTACKRGSVKARDPLTPREMQSLLERLAAAENPWTCPHGRPVFFRQSLPALEKQFKRV